MFRLILLESLYKTPTLPPAVRSYRRQTENVWKPLEGASRRWGEQAHHNLSSKAGVQRTDGTAGSVLRSCDGWKCPRRWSCAPLGTHFCEALCPGCEMWERRWTGNGKKVYKVTNDEGQGTRGEGWNMTSRAWRRRGCDRLTPEKNKEERPEDVGNTLSQIQPQRILQRLDRTGSLTEASVARFGGHGPPTTDTVSNAFLHFLDTCLLTGENLCLSSLINMMRTFYSYLIYLIFLQCPDLHTKIVTWFDKIKYSCLTLNPLIWHWKDSDDKCVHSK